MSNLLWSGGEIPHIGRYGGHIWQTLGFWELDARVELILSTEKASKRLEATNEESNYGHNHA